MGAPVTERFVMNLRFHDRSASREALRQVEAGSGLTILRGRVTATSARLEVARQADRK